MPPLIMQPTIPVPTHLNLVLPPLIMSNCGPAPTYHMTWIVVLPCTHQVSLVKVVSFLCPLTIWPLYSSDASATALSQVSLPPLSWVMSICQYLTPQHRNTEIRVTLKSVRVNMQLFPFFFMLFFLNLEGTASSHFTVMKLYYTWECDGIRQSESEIYQNSINNINNEHLEFLIFQ